MASQPSKDCCRLPGGSSMMHRCPLQVPQERKTPAASPNSKPFSCSNLVCLLEFRPPHLNVSALEPTGWTETHFYSSDRSQRVGSTIENHGTHMRYGDENVWQLAQLLDDLSESSTKTTSHVFSFLFSKKSSNILQKPIRFATFKHLLPPASQKARSHRHAQESAQHRCHPEVGTAMRLECNLTFQKTPQNMMVIFNIHLSKMNLANGEQINQTSTNLLF